MGSLHEHRAVSTETETETVGPNAEGTATVYNEWTWGICSCGYVIEHKKLTKTYER